MSKKKIPLYLKIAEELIADIEKQKYKIGQLLPTEIELENYFNVSRTTIRNAIIKLVDKGYVLKKQGKGTIIIEQKTTQKLNYISSLTETFEQKGMSVKTSALSIRIVEPPPKVVLALNISNNDLVYLVQRTRIVNDIPIAFVTNYLLKRKVPDLENNYEKLLNTGLYQLLENEYNLKLYKAIEKISVYLSGPLDTEIFNISINTPLFKSQRITYLEDGSIFELAISIIRADKYEFDVYLEGRPNNK